MNKLKELIKKNKITVILAVLGLAGGYVYWHYWGCTDGCPIRSNASLMTVYGGLIGGLLGNVVQGFGKKSKSPEEK